MFEFFEIKNVFFDFFFHFRRGGLRRLIPRSLAKTLIRRKKTKIELFVQHYDEMKKQKRNARLSFDFDLFLTN